MQWDGPSTTLWWRSPEQLIKGYLKVCEEDCFKSDIWSLGIIFFQMLSSKLQYYEKLRGTSELDQLRIFARFFPFPNSIRENFDYIRNKFNGFDVDALKPTDGDILSLMMRGPELRGASNDAKDLLGKILMCNPEARLSAEGVLSHRFFCSVPCYPSKLNWRPASSVPSFLSRPCGNQMLSVRNYGESFCWVKELAWRIPSLLSSDDTLFLCMALYRHVLCTPEFSAVIKRDNAQLYLCACYLLTAFYNGDMW